MSPDSPHLPSNATDMPPFYVGPWLIEPALNRITLKGDPIHVEPRVMHVMVCMASRPGEVVLRNEILETVWANVVVNEEATTQAISRLRQVLGDESRAPRFIETIPKTGYRLIAPLSPAEGRAEEATPPPRETGRSLRRGAILIGIGAAVLLISQWLPEREVGPDQAVILVDTPFTSFPGREVLPAISPDGTQVVFSWDGDKGGQYDLYLKQENSETPLQLTDNPGNEGHSTWSPDGTTIAFGGEREGVEGIFTIPAIGGVQRNLIDLPLLLFGIDWSPSDEWIVYSTRDATGEPKRLYLLSTTDNSTHALTEPSLRMMGDRLPAFSPDGRTVAFVRGSIGNKEDIYIIPVEGGEPRRVTRVNRQLKGLAWTRNGEHLVTAAGPDLAGEYRLWRVTLSDGSINWLPTRGKRVSRPSTARLADRLVYEDQIFECSIARSPLEGGEEAVNMVSSTRTDFAAGYSPDGSRIVFISTRSGNPEVWICDSEGGSLRKLTSFDGAYVGIPVWSHDSQRIAFNATTGEFDAIYVSGVESGSLNMITKGTTNDKALAWSADGQSIYYRTDCESKWELRRIALESGEKTSIYQGEVHRAAESPDGRYLYFSLPDSKGIRRLPLAGGEEEVVLDQLSRVYQSFWRLVENGLYVFKQHPRGMLVCYQDLESGEFRNLGRTIRLTGFTMDISPDGKWLLYDQVSRVESDLVLVDNFR